MLILWYEINEKFKFIFRLQPEDGVWTYVNNLDSASLKNMQQESNPVLGECNKILGT